MPEPRSECETDLFDALTIMFLAPRDAARARTAVRAAVGDGTFEILVAYLAFIRTAHYWTEMHPELTYEPDMAEMLGGYGELADLLLDTSEAEFVQGGVRLRETLMNLKRVEVALVESESRIVEQLRDDSARKDEFLAMLAHELRNPLAPIRTGLELIRRGGDTDVSVGARARDDGASSRSHGSTDRRPAGRVENHVRQDCPPTRASTARRAWSTAPWKPTSRPCLPNRSP